MKAITIPTPGDADALVLEEVPEPSAGPGEVVIEVAAAGVNRADLLQRMGVYPPPPGASAYPGLEVSGRIAQLGPQVSGWSVGDEVCALLAGGGYAQQVAVAADQLLPVPSGVSLEDAASLPETACTVWNNLVMVAGLHSGQRVLIHGGSSGIGTMGIQVARGIGAEVAVTAGSAEKVAACQKLGANLAINYREQEFEKVIKEEWGGVDVILDTIGAKYLSRNVSALATDGHMVTIGLLGGVKGELNLGALLTKRATISATSLRTRPAHEKAEIVAATREHVWPLIESGAITPVIASRYPLGEASDAHRELEASTHIGKVLLIP